MKYKLLAVLVMSAFLIAGNVLAAPFTPNSDAEISGNWTFTHNPTFSGTPSFTGTPTFSGGLTDATGGVTATEIADVTRSFELPLAAAFIDGTGVMGNDGTTAPGLAETDNIPAIVYASSAESTKIQWTFKLPADYVSGLAFHVLVSSSAATSAGQSIDWQFWVNGDDVTFDAAAISQDAVSLTSSTLDASCELVTLTIDATGEAAISSGSVLTVDIWNAGTSDNTTEIKGVQARYTATQ